MIMLMRVLYYLIVLLKGNIGDIHTAGKEPILAYLHELDASDYPYDMVQLRYSIGADNGPPDPYLPQFVRRWNSRYASPRLVIATTHEMFREFERRYGAELPTVSGDFTPYWEDGAASSAWETSLHRAAADRLVQAQTLWAMLDPHGYPSDAFRAAWRNVLLYSEHTWGGHDRGSNPDSKLEQAVWSKKRATALDATWQSRELLQAALGSTVGQDRGTSTFQVFNTASWPRTDLVVLAKENKELGTAVRLPDGKTLIVERGPKPRLLEVDSKGAIKVEVPLQPDTKNHHMQTRMARKLPDGNYLVPHLLAFKVKEYTPEGKVVKVFKTDLESLGGRKAQNWPFTAIRLENGNTLVTLTHGNKTVEFDPKGKVAWRCDNSDVGGRFADPCGAQRLPNGNTVIASYGQRKPDKPKIFEVTREKKVAWEFFHPKVRAHELHLLTTNGKPIKDVTLK